MCLMNYKGVRLIVDKAQSSLNRINRDPLIDLLKPFLLLYATYINIKHMSNDNVGL